MTLTEAISSLQHDLERYASSGKASPKAVAFRELVLNTIIEAINGMESTIQVERQRHTEQVNALRQDLRQRDTTLSTIALDTLAYEPFWALEGSAQRILTHMLARVDHNEGRTMSKERAQRERSMVRSLIAEFERMHDDAQSIGHSAFKAAAELRDLKQYARMYGMDVEQFEGLSDDLRALLRPDSSPPFSDVPGARPASPVQRHLQLSRWYRSAPALKAMIEHRAASGIIDEAGNPTGHYARPDHALYTVLTMLRDRESWDRIRQEHAEAYTEFTTRTGAQPHTEKPWAVAAP